jgi:hypothetical protein
MREACERNAVSCDRVHVHDVGVELAAALDIMAKLREYAGDERPEMRAFATAWTVAKLQSERLCRAYVEAWKDGK